MTIETIGPREILIGRESVFKLVLRNTAEVSADDVAVMVSLPEWATVVDASPSSGSARAAVTRDANGGVVWNLNKLGARASEQLVLKVVPRESGPLDLAVQWTAAPTKTQVRVDVKEPKLELSIKGPKQVAYGETAIYQLTFSNPGTADAENVMVRLLPIEQGDSPDSHRIGTIPAGGKKVVEVELVARQTGQLAIRAEATADGGLRSPVHHKIEVLRADLRVELEAPEFRYAGTVATFKVRVTNTGNAPASGVEVGMVLPARAKYLSSTCEGKQEEGGKVRWTLKSLKPGEEQVYLLRCELIQPGANRMQVVAVADGDLRDTINSTTEVEALANLDLEVIDPKGPVPVGEEVIYEVVVRNRGTKSATHVELQVLFSDGVTPVAVRGVEHTIRGAEVVMGPIPTLDAGDEVVIKITAKASVGGNHTIRVELQCKSLETRLAEQETTRFYGNDRIRKADRPASSRSTSRFESNPPTADRYAPTPVEGVAEPLEPTPLEPTSLEPTPLEPTAADAFEGR